MGTEKRNMKRAQTPVAYPNPNRKLENKDSGIFNLTLKTFWPSIAGIRFNEFLAWICEVFFILTCFGIIEFVIYLIDLVKSRFETLVFDQAILLANPGLIDQEMQGLTNIVIALFGIFIGAGILAAIAYCAWNSMIFAFLSSRRLERAWHKRFLKTTIPIALSLVLLIALMAYLFKPEYYTLGILVIFLVGEFFMTATNLALSQKQDGERSASLSVLATYKLAISDYILRPLKIILPVLIWIVIYALVMWGLGFVLDNTNTWLILGTLSITTIWLRKYLWMIDNKTVFD